MSILLLGASMLLSIENHEGMYLPRTKDMQPFIGVHYKATVVAPSGSYQASNAPTRLAGAFSWSVVSTWKSDPVVCSIVKVICAYEGAYHCDYQRLKYMLYFNSPIGETNVSVPLSKTFQYQGTYQTSSHVLFNECGGLPAHNVESKGTINIY